MPVCIYVEKENGRLCSRMGWRNCAGDVAASFSLSLSPCFCVRRRRVKGLKMVAVNALEISVNGGIFLERGKRVRP